MMHDTLAHHPLMDAHPIPEQQLVPPCQLSPVCVLDLMFFCVECIPLASSAQLSWPYFLLASCTPPC